ncbi:MAG: M1 family aminopeptidase [Bacteroidetes bacterium]|nr:M1 family aminopeptidase [Bacteroidota bacterium]
MKIRLSLATLFFSILFLTYAQDFSTMPGSAYCARKKAGSPNLSSRLLKSTASIPHSFDVIKYTLNVDLYNCYSAPYPKSFSGSATISFKVDSALNSIKLNAKNFSMIIDSVRLAGVLFTHINDYLTIQLNRTYNAGESANVKIYYRHQDVQDSAFYSNAGVVFTDCEPEGARKWFPCWDSPSDKALLDLTAKVKANVKLGSNGRLADSTLNGDFLTYHWVSDQNIATYLVAITSKVNYQLNIGWWHKLSNPADSVPFRYYFNLGENPAPVMAIMPAMTSWFSQNFIEHPFDKNGFATLNPDFVWGGMENQTLTSLCPNCWQESLAAHEFAHQWFGDMITCSTWADIWLNEGFATWTEAFWYESYAGYGAYKSTINNNASYYLSNNPGWAISDPQWAITTPSTDILFDYYITYLKGSCVLHQLRYVLGDSLFFQTLKSYCADTTLKFHSATIHDFNAKVNQVTGEDYTWFFDEWIYQPNHPIYQNTYNFQDLGNNQWKVNFFMKQIQSNPSFFKMPVEVYIRFSDATDTTIRVMNDANNQQFYWQFGKQPVFFRFDNDKQIVLKGGSTIVGINEVMASSAHVSLSQNSPNPACNSTHICYTTDANMDVKLEITDVYGVVLARPVDKQQPAGRYEITLDCSTFPAGQYLYKLSAGDSRLVKKFVIIK